MSFVRVLIPVPHPLEQSPHGSQEAQSQNLYWPPLQFPLGGAANEPWAAIISTIVIPTIEALTRIFIPERLQITRLFLLVPVPIFWFSFKWTITILSSNFYLTRDNLIPGKIFIVYSIWILSVNIIWTFLYFHIFNLTMYKCRYVIDFQPITGYSSDVFIRQSKCFNCSEHN